MAFSRRKRTAWKKPLIIAFSKATPVAMPRSVAGCLSDSSIRTSDSLSPTNTSPVRTNTKHAAYLVLSSFPACCFQMGQNYWSHLEILWLYICRGNSGGSFPLIPSEEFMNYYCFSVQGFPMWGFFRVQYDKFGTTPDRSPAKSNIHRLKNVHRPPGTVHRPSQTSVTGWAVTPLQSLKTLS